MGTVWEQSSGFTIIFAVIDLYSGVSPVTVVIWGWKVFCWFPVSWRDPLCQAMTVLHRPIMPLRWFPCRRYIYVLVELAGRRCAIEVYMISWPMVCSFLRCSLSLRRRRESNHGVSCCIYCTLFDYGKHRSRGRHASSCSINVSLLQNSCDLINLPS